MRQPETPLYTVLSDPEVVPGSQLPWDADLPRRLPDAHVLDPVSTNCLGAEPTRSPELFATLAALTAEGRPATLHTDLPDFGDDRTLRPYAPYDVRFQVRYPTCDPDLYASLCGRELESLESGLRNLRAFGYPIRWVVPVTPQTLPTLAKTVIHLVHDASARFVDLHVLGHGPPEDPSWRWSVSDRDLARQLLAIERLRHKPTPRIRVHGRHALRLPVAGLEDLDVRAEGRAGDTLVDDTGYRTHHDDPLPAGDELAARRAMLVRDPKDRPYFRSDPRDRLGDPVATSLIRPRQLVFALVERRREGVPYLATTHHYGLALRGRMDDAVLSARFRDLCLLVRDHVRQHPPGDLARLRELASILRRGMKPRHDDTPVRLREEGE